MYNPGTQVQVPTDANLGSYFQKTKIAIGASPTAFPFKKIYINYCIRIFSKHMFILCLFGITDIDTFSSILSQSLQNFSLTKPRT
jgi:hypothetical protein